MTNILVSPEAYARKLLSHFDAAEAYQLFGSYADLRKQPLFAHVPASWHASVQSILKTAAGDRVR